MKGSSIEFSRAAWGILVVPVLLAAAVWLIGGLLVFCLVAPIELIFDSDLRRKIKEPLTNGLLTKKE